MEDSLRDVGEKLSKVAALLAGPDLRAITNRVANRAKGDALQQLDSDLPGRKFTNWRPKLSVGYEVVDDGTAKLKPRPNGPWKVLTEGRSPGSKYSRKAKRVIGWGATRGRRTWDHVNLTVGHNVPGYVDAEVQSALRKVFH